MTHEPGSWCWLTEHLQLLALRHCCLILYTLFCNSHHMCPTRISLYHIRSDDRESSGTTYMKLMCVHHGRHCRRCDTRFVVHALSSRSVSGYQLDGPTIYVYLSAVFPKVGYIARTSQRDGKSYKLNREGGIVYKCCWWHFQYEFHHLNYPSTITIISYIIYIIYRLICIWVHNTLICYRIDDE